MEVPNRTMPLRREHITNTSCHCKTDFMILEVVIFKDLRITTAYHCITNPYRGCLPSFSKLFEALSKLFTVTLPSQGLSVFSNHG